MSPTDTNQCRPMSPTEANHAHDSLFLSPTDTHGHLLSPAEAKNIKLFSAFTSSTHNTTASASASTVVQARPASSRFVHPLPPRRSSAKEKLHWNPSPSPVCYLTAIHQMSYNSRKSAGGVARAWKPYSKSAHWVWKRGIFSSGFFLKHSPHAVPLRF